MAKLVGVHGIFHQYEGPHSVKGEWLDALKDGVGKAGVQIADQDLVCAFYGDLFRKQDTKSAPIPPFTWRDLEGDDAERTWEQCLLEQWWQEASACESRVVSPNANTKARTPLFVQRALNALSNSDFFGAVGGERVLIFGLRQVRMYLHNPLVRAEARNRVRSVIGADTTVLIGHSLGSVVAYEVLCDPVDNWNIKTFVTLGSPLGISELIFDRLDPRPELGKGRWPKVRHWFNIVDNGDVVALVKDLSTKFNGGVQNRLVHNGWESHNVKHYLTSQEVGEAIATGL